MNRLGYQSMDRLEILVHEQIADPSPLTDQAYQSMNKGKILVYSQIGDTSPWELFSINLTPALIL